MIIILIIIYIFFSYLLSIDKKILFYIISLPHREGTNLSLIKVVS